jgi:hypothetical protein
MNTYASTRSGTVAVCHHGLAPTREALLRSAQQGTGTVLDEVDLDFRERPTGVVPDEVSAIGKRDASPR